MLATFNNWKLSRKMMVAFTLIGLLLGLVAVSGIVSNIRLAAIASRHVTRGLTGTALIGNIVSQIREQRIIVYSRHTALDGAEVAKLRERLDKNQAALTEGVAEYRRVAGSGFEPEVAALAAEVARVNGIATRIFAARESGTEQSLALIKAEGKIASAVAVEAAELLLKKTEARANAANTEGQAFADMALLVACAFSAIALMGLIGVWLLIARTVARPMDALATTTTRLAEGIKAMVPSLERKDELGEIARAVQSFSDAAARRAETDAAAAVEQAGVTTALGNSLRAMSDGDLTIAVTADFAPSYQALKTDFNAALGSLSGIIGSVGEGVVAIRTGASEIAQASEDLARRTESNAASLEETSAALVQIDGRIKASATATETTVARADKAINSVSSGRSTAEVAVQAMSRVSSSAKGIDSVIEGVDKIAFQTRVLAMNAAVEAGRAGDAGRGFAVVADLVSALALRAEEEAKRARDQLTVTQAEILIAVGAVEKVDSTFVDISGDVEAVHGLLETMAQDNMVQSAAITQITAAVGTMDKATQQNAAMVEQTSAAARNLTTEVDALAELARSFRVDSTPATSKFAARTQAPTPAKQAPPAKRAVERNAPKLALAANQSGSWSDF